MIKEKVKTLPCISIPHPSAFIIIETDASDIGYRGIRKQQLPDQSKETLVRYYLGVWSGPQKNYSTVKKKFY